MRHDEHRDVLRAIPISTRHAAAVAAAAAACATIAIPASAVAVAASACRDVADNAFRLVLDASPDGLSVLGWQRLPGCE